MGIQINGTTNNINAGIGSLSIEDIRELDITGVATASNFKTGISNLHDVGLTLTGGQIDVGSNIKIGTAGVITATSFVGSGANLTGLPAGVTINNNATTKFITGTNNANELDCEANLSYNNSVVTFASSNLTINKSASPTISVTETSGNKSGQFRTNTDGVLVRSLGNYPLIFHTNQTERAQIDGSGRFLIGTNSVYNANSYSNNLIIYENGDAGASIIGNASNSNYASLYLSDTSTASKAFLEAQLGVNGNFTIGTNGSGPIRFTNSGGERLRVTGAGRLGLGETSPDYMLHITGTVPAICFEDTSGTHGQSIIEQNNDILKIRCDAGNASSGTDSVIQFEVDAFPYGKVDSLFGVKGDNTCKTWLCYRSEAGSEGIIDDFNVSNVNDEGTGTFYVNLDRNIHRHGNGWSQSIVFGCYNDGSRQLIAGVGYAPSHGSNNPWWDVEDNGCRVQTQRSTDGTVVDAKVFNMAMFGDTGDLRPT